MAFGFPPPHIIQPTLPHTHTVILLHGRSSNGPEFADELFSSKCSAKENLPSLFPTIRWVFPTAKHIWSEAFQEEFCAWFDIYSISDPNERQETQIEGLRESTLYILDLINKENDILLDPEKLILGGMSQGMATALWTLLCSPGRIRMKEKGRIGGVLGLCGWLPFTNKIEEEMATWPEDNDCGMLLSVLRKLPNFITLRNGDGDNNSSSSRFKAAGLMDIGVMLTSTPVLLLHGTDDALVDVELGKKACGILRRLWMSVGWEEYEGAENEGHWIKEPEGVDAIVRFLGMELLKWTTPGDVGAALVAEAPKTYLGT